MHTFVRKSALAILTILVFLALAEGVLRLFGVGEWVPTIDVDENVSRALSRGWLKEDRDLLWRMSECDSGCEAIRSVHPDNPRVASGEEYRRIICLGDSCTFFSTSGNPYSVLLEDLLSPTNRVQVLNASVPGYSSTQGLAWLKNELLDYRPDIVTVYFGWNDHWLARAMTDSEYLKRIKLSPFRIVRLALALGGRTASLDAESEDLSRRVPLDEYAKNLTHIHRLVESVGSQCIFITAPAREAADTRNSLIDRAHIRHDDDYIEIHERYNAVVRRLADEGSRVIDLATSFNDVPDVNSLLTDDGIHLTDRGHARAADALLSAITSHGLLD